MTLPSHHGVVFDTLSSHLQPIRGRKVNGLRQIVTLVEAGVIGAWKRDHEFAGVLVGAVYGNAVCLNSNVEKKPFYFGSIN